MTVNKYSLKELRARKNVSQKEAAAALGVSTPTYNAWEKNISKVAVGKVVLLANYYGVKLEEIFFPEYLKNIQAGKRRN